MRILDWIIKIYEFFKEWIDRIIQIVAIVGILSTFISVRSCQKQMDTKNNMINAIKYDLLYSKSKLGKKIAEVNNLKVNYKTLKRFAEVKDAENGSLKHELNLAYETIGDYKIRLRDAENYIKTEFNSKDSSLTKIVFLEPDKIKIDPIRKPHYSIDFRQTENGLVVNHEYWATVTTVISRYPELKENGKKHFPNWGNLPWVGWDYKTTASVDDTTADITNIVQISFDR